MKFCTLILYYITTIIRQLKFLSLIVLLFVAIVLFVVCMIAKDGLKNDRNFKFFEIKRNSHD